MGEGKEEGEIRNEGRGSRTQRPILLRLKEIREERAGGAKETFVDVGLRN